VNGLGTFVGIFVVEDSRLRRAAETAELQQ